MVGSSTAAARESRRRMTSYGWESLCTAAQMDRVLRREMARADRGNHSFSLVLFRVRPGPRHHLSTHRLARALLARARLTDVAGWFSDSYLCALLTDTSAEGARVFADRVCFDVSQKAPRPLALVYTYAPEVKANGGGLAGINGDGPSTGRAAGANGHSNGHRRRDGLERPPILNRDAPCEMGMTMTDTACAVGSDAEASPSCGQLDLARFVQQGFATQFDDPAWVDGCVEELVAYPLPGWKRVIDVAGAIAASVLLSPLLVAAAIGVFLTSRGPVIFKQRRTGLGGRPFTIYKFRTMVSGAEKKRRELSGLSEQDGPAFKLKNDPRLTAFGRFLRKTSIDELPQLYNVLKGDMSLVGPRPLPCDESDACQPWQKRRLDVTPGLTCIWQVKGRSRVSFDEWVRMDMAYLRRRTFWQDVRILAATVPAVLMRKGAK